MELQCLYPCPTFDIFIWRRSRGGKVRGEVCVQLRGVQGMDFPGSNIVVKPQVESQSTFQMCLQWKYVIKGCGCGVWEQTVGKPEVTWCDRDGLQSH